MSTPDLKLLEAHVRDLREKEKQIEDLEEELKALRAQVRFIRTQQLPELFYEAQVDHIGLPAEGNRPAVDAKLRKEYKASIPESWPDNKRRAAFDTLDELDMSDLQKITFTVIFEAGSPLTFAAASRAAAGSCVGAHSSQPSVRHHAVHETGSICAWATSGCS